MNAHLQRGVPGLRFSRTLYGCEGAFKDSPEYAASWLEPHDISDEPVWRLRDLLFCVGLVAGVAWMVLKWLP